MNMKNGNSEIKDSFYYEDINDKNRNFEFEFDIDEAEEYFIKGIGNIKNVDYEEIYEKGFKDGYEKAKQEALDYLEKNKNHKKKNF
jgi:flagellar biosynthesis/type III secretory pathway protein FliH